MDVGAWLSHDTKTNVHGLLGVESSIKTIQEQCDGLDSWWNDPNALFPYLIRVDDIPSGFNLIAARSRLPDGIEHNTYYL